MTVLKCSMCGGDLQVNDATNIAICGSCGSTMTIAKKNDGQKTNFFRTVVHNNIDVDANDILNNTLDHINAVNSDIHNHIAEMNTEMDNNIKNNGIVHTVTSSSSSSSTHHRKVNSNSNSKASPLLERAFICIEDSDFEKADELLEQVLNMEPKNAKAYIGKLLCELELTCEEELVDIEESLTEYGNYNNALRFADANYKAILDAYEQCILKRLDDAEKEKVYCRALDFKKYRLYEDACQLLNSISGYKNADALLVECERLANEYKLVSKRSNKIVTILFFVFLILAIGGPFVLKYLPEIKAVQAEKTLDKLRDDANASINANDLLGIWKGETRSDGYRIYLYFKDKSVYWMLSKSDITSISFKDVISYEKTYSLDPYNPDEDVVFGFIRGNNKSFLFKLNKSISGDIDFTVDWETHEDIYTKIE